MQRLEDMGKFKTVVIDPPWDIKFGSPVSQEDLRQERERRIQNGQMPRLHAAKDGGSSLCTYVGLNYETMPLDDIRAMPIQEVLDDDALVFLWATQSTLPDAISLIASWDLRYSYVMTWHKPFGPKPFNRPLYNSEFAVVGTKGKPQYLQETQFFTANTWAHPRQKSVKPEGFYDLLRRVTPAPRLDIFGRRRIAGFHSWGNEAPEGEPDGDHYQIPMSAD